MEKRNREKYQKMAEELVAQMTIEEAASQLLHHAPAIERLNVPEYNWWNEGLHGLARAGIATVFPQAIGMAASFDPVFLEEEAQIIALETRAKYNMSQKAGDNDIYKGLTVWSPNVNIFRDPKWGRGHETYGEDPYLTARMGVAFIRGMQGGGDYLKTAACVKHLAVHSGPENLRHGFDARVTEKDLRETYLPAFEAAVKEGGVESVMGAYNRVNGEPCCGSERLLVKILRGEWGFDGHVVSDCWAVRDFHENHHYTERPAQSASLAVRMGCDLNCGCTYENLLAGLEEGLITEEEIRRSAKRLFTTRFSLGMFDENCKYNEIPYSVVNTKEHKKAALAAAERSLVLLKNDGLLPLCKDKVKNIGVIGPNAYSATALYGNYNGDSGEWITNLDGIRREAGDDIRVWYSEGCHISKEADDPLCRRERLFGEAVAVAEESDVVILCVGLNSDLEGEEGDEGNAFASGDKESLLLPECQQRLVEKIISVGKPVVLVINSGSSLDLSAYENQVSAVIQAWYSGERGGEALSNVLFGKTNPSGKLPVTFYYDAQPMPDFTDYHMAGRTYRYVEAAPWYPFGYGLSYSEFSYDNIWAKPQENGVDVHVRVTNEGTMDGGEITQLYIRYEGEAFEKPHHKLAAFERTVLKAGEGKELVFCLTSKDFLSVKEDGENVLYEGVYTIFVGGSQPDERSVALMKKMPRAVGIRVKGETFAAEGGGGAKPYRYPDQNDYAAKVVVRKKWGLHTPLCEIFADERAGGILMEGIPMLKDAPQLAMLKGLAMSLKDMAKMSGGVFGPELMASLETKLSELNE